MTMSSVGNGFESVHNIICLASEGLEIWKRQEASMRVEKSPTSLYPTVVMCTRFILDYSYFLRHRSETIGATRA